MIPAQPGKVVLQAQGLGKRFGERSVLHDASLQVDEGETVVIIGPSGSGKTTLLRCLNWLETPDTGCVLLRGVAIGRSPAGRPLAEPVLAAQRARFGFVFQRFNLFSHLSALDNVALGPQRVLGLQAVAARERAREQLARVHLAAHVDKRPSQLSGGQQQRVAIARALAMDPPLVLADEPTVNLDTASADAAFDLMREFNRSRGTTFLIVTHDPRLARRCDRIVEVVDGRIVADAAVAAPMLHGAG
ncbi:MAG TPA: ABC transporter ATP-binding protein [Rubrivivax sp.]|nr:ABC transporter ATP-binding protein [Rubrivivax sp.]